MPLQQRKNKRGHRRFSEGQLVTLSGLKSKPSWNGQTARITGRFNNAKKRWPVTLVQIDGAALIRPKNMSPRKNVVLDDAQKTTTLTPIPKCPNCKEQYTEDDCERKQCMECKASICSYCGICDPCIIESQADFVCQQCVPLKCSECSRVLIDKNAWEERIEYCNGCGKRFCNEFLNPNCLKPLCDEYGEEYAWQCRHCIKKPKIHTDAGTLQKYVVHLKEQGLEQKEMPFEDWISQQNDPLLTFRRDIGENDDSMPKGNGISKAEHDEKEIIDEIRNGEHVMGRTILEAMIAQARDLGSAPPPLQCHACGAADKDRYCMLRTNVIQYECVDCAVQAALDARY